MHLTIILSSSGTPQASYASPPASPHIVIFDSGLGGISIYDEVRRQLPYAQLSYCSDNQAFPYGTKSEPELTKRVSRILTTLNKQLSPDLFIIACNTASTLVLPKIRNLIKQPVIGVVPAIKPAAATSQTPYIGLLATQKTVDGAYTKNLIQQFGSQQQWIKVGSVDLVQLAEQKMYGEKPSLDKIKKTIQPFLKYTSSQLDTIILGCTHFPLIKEELQQALPQIKNWVDSTEAIVKRVDFWLHELGFSQTESKPLSHTNTLVFTQTPDKKTDLTALQTSRAFKNTITLD